MDVLVGVWRSRSTTLDVSIVSDVVATVGGELTIIISCIGLIMGYRLIKTLVLAATFIITACNLNRSSVVIAVRLELTPEIRCPISIRTKALGIHL